MVEGVDEWEGRGTIEGSAVVEGGGDADRGFIDIGDVEIDFSHDEKWYHCATPCRWCSEAKLARSGVFSGETCKVD